MITSFNAGLSSSDGSSVYNIYINGTTLYVGGIFTTISGQARKNLAAYDTLTNTITSFAPPFAGGVSNMAFNGTTLYEIGNFDFYNGVARNSLAAIDPTTRQATSWDPEYLDR